MSCEDVQALLEIPPELRSPEDVRSLRSHCERCAACKSLEARLEDGVRRFGSRPEPLPGPEALQGLMARLEQDWARPASDTRAALPGMPPALSHTASFRMQRRLSPSARAFAAAAVLLLTLLGIRRMTSDSAEQSDAKGDPFRDLGQKGVRNGHPPIEAGAMSVSLELYRESEPGRIEPLEGGGTTRLGDGLYFRVVMPEEASLVLLERGPDGSVSILYPSTDPPLSLGGEASWDTASGTPAKGLSLLLDGRPVRYRLEQAGPYAFAAVGSKKALELPEGDAGGLWTRWVEQGAAPRRDDDRAVEVVRLQVREPGASPPATQGP